MGQSTHTPVADDRLVITAGEAASLLHDDAEYVHTFMQKGSVFLGCDYERDGALKAFRAAEEIEIGGPACRRMGHAIVVRDIAGRHVFFEADMEKVAAFEAARASASEEE